MATFNPRRFAQPDLLKSIQPRHLFALLQPHSSYLTGRGLAFPASDEEEFEYSKLAEILVHPDEDMPRDLVDSLYTVHEMATPAGMEELLDEISRNGLQLEALSEPTPADVAVQVWLKDRELLERKHAEQFIEHPRRFEHHKGGGLVLQELPVPAPDALAKLEQDLDNWFEDKRRGRGCRVFVFPKDTEVWYLVRHGMPMKREGSIDKGEPSSVYYRPQKHDIVVYDAALDDLRVNAGTKGEKALYVEQFGLHVFGRPDYFAGTKKYTLEPLLRDGEASLDCSDIEGVEWIRLKEIVYSVGGPEHEKEIRKADDLFAALKRRDRKIRSLPILKAGFLVKFKDSKAARSVSILPPNIAEYTRDSDADIIETWLARRGFTVASPVGTDAQA